MLAASIAPALVLLALCESAVAASLPWPPDCAMTPISVRLPPTFGIDPPNWKSPQPDDRFYSLGYWYQTNSSSADSIMRNLEYSTEPIDPGNPKGPRTDLASFQVAGNDTVFTSYGVDTPKSTPATFTYAGTGILDGATDSLEILAWGSDCYGTPYRVTYSSYTEFTQTPASIDVLSRAPRGPDSAILGQILRQLVAFGNDDVTALAQAIGPSPYDGKRKGSPPVDECGDYCQTNENLLPLMQSYSVRV